MSIFPGVFFSCPKNRNQNVLATKAQRRQSHCSILCRWESLTRNWSILKLIENLILLESREGWGKSSGPFGQYSSTAVPPIFHSWLIRGCHTLSCKLRGGVSLVLLVAQWGRHVRMSAVCTCRWFRVFHISGTTGQIALKCGVCLELRR